jgi:single-strand DNA-binding protein
MASDVNHWIGIGRSVRDGELKYLSSGTPVLKFSLALNRRIKRGDEWVDEGNFFDIVYYGKAAESVANYIVKGKQLAVEGELHQNRWEKDGQTHSKVEIIAQNVQLLGGGQAGNGQGRGQQSRAGSGYGSERQNASAGPSGADEGGYDDSVPPDFPDDIPFS